MGEGSNLDAARDHVQGEIEAPTTLLGYGDYECRFCARARPIIREIQQRLGDELCFAFRHFPVTPVHPHAQRAAEAAEAANAQGNCQPWFERFDIEGAHQCRGNARR